MWRCLLLVAAVGCGASVENGQADGAGGGGADLAGAGGEPATACDPWVKVKHPTVNPGPIEYSCCAEVELPACPTTFACAPQRLCDGVCVHVYFEEGDACTDLLDGSPGVCTVVDGAMRCVIR